jgi:hypothetical protein
MPPRQQEPGASDEKKEQGAPRQIHFELEPTARDECPFDHDASDDDNSLACSDENDDENDDESTQTSDDMSRQFSTTAKRLRWTVIFLFCLLTIAVPLIIYFALRDEEEDAIKPLIYAFIVFGAFIVDALLALSYDQITQQHLERISSSERAALSVVDKFYPEVVQDKTFRNQKEISSIVHPKTNLKNFLIGNENDGNQELLAKPIADLFTSCTVCFANITGFTAWSSEREPQQVFLLLETIFGILDKIAKKGRVFKVETGKDGKLLSSRIFSLSNLNNRSLN